MAGFAPSDDGYNKSISDNSNSSALVSRDQVASWGLIQYKDAILPV